MTEVESEITCLLCKGLYLEQLHLPGIAPSFSTGLTMSYIEVMRAVQGRIRARASLRILTVDLFILATKCRMALRGEHYGCRELPVMAASLNPCLHVCLEYITITGTGSCTCVEPLTRGDVNTQEDYEQWYQDTLAKRGAS